jgi:hypothetical protein
MPERGIDPLPMIGSGLIGPKPDEDLAGIERRG